jgi:putative hydroxymethylpyrimidine transport system substrate-binding protein
MKQARWLWVIALLLAALVVGFACGGGDEAKTPPVKVRVALDWFPWSNHSGLYIAREKGYFAQEGLEVTIYTPDDPATVLATVGAGRDDFGLSYQTEVLLAREKGVPAVSIAALVQHPLNSVMALKASGIQRPRDLVGKKVGSPGIPTDAPLLRSMLKADGLTDAQVEASLKSTVNVGFDLVPALISKRVDAIVGAYWVHESISAENQGFPVNIMRMEQWGVPDFYEIVLVTSDKLAKEKPELVQRFIRAALRGYRDAVADPQAAVDVLKRGAPEIDEKIERPGVKLLAPMWSEPGVSFGWQTADKWEKLTHWMQANKLLGTHVDHAKAFTNRFVEAAAKQ